MAQAFLAVRPADQFGVRRLDAALLVVEGPSAVFALLPGGADPYSALSLFSRKLARRRSSVLVGALVPAGPLPEGR